MAGNELFLSTLSSVKGKFDDVPPARLEHGPTMLSVVAFDADGDSDLDLLYSLCHSPAPLCPDTQTLPYTLHIHTATRNRSRRWAGSTVLQRAWRTLVEMQL